MSALPVTARRETKRSKAAGAVTARCETKRSKAARAVTARRETERRETERALMDLLEMPRPAPHEGGLALTMGGALLRARESPD